jgi:N,N'-diacetyllegionaminate synthase
VGNCFIIAEAGVNHNGSIERALALVDVAADAGADAVKFQTFRADDVVLPGTEKASYQKTQTGLGDQHSMIKALELSEADHERIAAHCRDREIEFMSTPFDFWSADLLVRLGIRRVKIPSGELTNRPFIEYLARNDLPIILSTGMARLEEVTDAVSWIAQTRKEMGFSQPLAKLLTILHCTSNYPAAFEDVNLRAMTTLADTLEFPVGYSDHTLGIEIAIAAVAMGANVIEKHFTLNRSLPGPDHQASLDPAQLKALVAGIRHVEAAFGDGKKQPTANEIPVRNLVRRSAFLARSVPAGQSLEAKDIAFLRPGDGIPPFELQTIVGKRTVTDLPAGTKLDWLHIR